MNGMNSQLLLGTAVVLALALPSALLAETRDAVDLSLEELLNTEVMTASRKAQRLNDVAAAVFIISREDIERSGATSIPEALRMAPGLQVARLANNRWAVSARGFGSRFANKLLVLMDGRSIYSPLFSGVIWEAEDTLLEDIERIEVIRGPGAAMWGSNAVNGVINIITRKTRDTQGNLLVAGTGTEERAFGAFRHGGQAGDGHYRVWGKAFSRDESTTGTGQRGNDDWTAGRVGFRGDWPLASGDRLMLSGQAYTGPTGDRWNAANPASPTGFTTTDMRQIGNGAHLLARREWIRPDGSEAAFQTYVDQSETGISNAFHEVRSTFDADFQQRARFAQQHDIIWGLGYRYSHDRISSQGVFLFEPRSRDFNLFSAFVHDEITLLPDTLRLILGARLEHNSFTGFEPQPNIRMTWTPTPYQALWGAVSRAVRIPSRIELDARADLSATPANPPVPAVLTRYVPRDDRTLLAERVTAAELGYRHQWNSKLSLDVTAFYNDYDNLRSTSIGSLLTTPPYLTLVVVPNNNLTARTHGIELSLDYHADSWWRLQPAYSYLWVTSRASSSDPVEQASAIAFEGRSPEHQLSLRSSMTLSGQRQLDVWLRHVSALENADRTGKVVPAYTTIDLRYAWKPTKGLELSLVGQNLLDRRHPEFVPDFPSELLQIERSLYFKAKWQF